MFNDLVSGLQLSNLCKDVCLESLIVQTTYKLVFHVDARYVCFASWTAKLTIHSKGTYSQEEVLYRFALTLHEITRVHPMSCWIHTFCDYFLSDFQHGRLINLKECGVRISKTVVLCHYRHCTDEVQSVRKGGLSSACTRSINDKFTKLLVCHIGNNGRHLA